MGRTTTNLEWLYSRIGLYVTELPDMKTVPVTSDQYFAAWYVARVFGLYMPIGYYGVLVGLYFFIFNLYEYGMRPTVGFGPLFASLIAKPTQAFILESILKPVLVTCPLVA